MLEGVQATFSTILWELRRKQSKEAAMQPYLSGAVGIVKLFFGKKYKMAMKREKKCEA